MNLWIVQIPNPDGTGAHILGYVAAATPQDALARASWVFERQPDTLHVAALLFVDGFKVRLEAMQQPGGQSGRDNVVPFPGTTGTGGDRN